MQVVSDFGWRASFIARHLRVLNGYRDVLADPTLPTSERDAIAERMRRIIQEIREAEDQLNSEAVAR